MVAEPVESEVDVAFDEAGAKSEIILLLNQLGVPIDPSERLFFVKGADIETLNEVLPKVLEVGEKLSELSLRADVSADTRMWCVGNSVHTLELDIKTKIMELEGGQM